MHLIKVLRGFAQVSAGFCPSFSRLLPKFQQGLLPKFQQAFAQVLVGSAKSSDFKVIF
jgi:hypothetical protein